MRRFFRENLAELDFFLNPYSFSGPRWKGEQLIPVRQEPRAAKTVELNRLRALPFYVNLTRVKSWILRLPEFGGHRRNDGREL